MTRYSRLAAALAVTLALASPCLAQGTLQGLGSVVPGQIPMYVGHNQVIGTGGAPAVGQSPVNQSNPGTLPSGLAIANSGQGLALYSGYANAAYSSLKAGFDGNGNVLFTIERSGGGNPPSCSFNIGGTLYACASSGGGIVGPNPTTVGHLVLWNNATGNLTRDAGTMLVSILAYGAVSGQDSTAAIQAAITAGCAGNFAIYVPDGDWRLTATLNIGAGCSNFRLVGQGPNAQLNYVGTDTLTTVVLVSGAIWYPGVENLTINGNSHVSYALQSWNAHHATFRNLRLRNAVISGYAGSYGVLNHYENMATSNNEQAYAVQPQSCWKAFDHGDSLGGLFASTVLNLICEGVSGTGIILENSTDNVFIASTSEGNTGRGVTIDSNSSRNTFISSDFEFNGIEDVVDQGAGNQWQNIISCCTGRFRIGATALGTKVIGGNFENITVNTGAGTGLASYSAIELRPALVSNSIALGNGTGTDINVDYPTFATPYGVTLSCGINTLIAYSATGSYKQNDKQVTVNIAAVVTNLGTCGGLIRATLPFTAAGGFNSTFSGYVAGGGAGVFGVVPNGTSTVEINKSDGTFPLGGPGTIQISGTYTRT